MSFDKEGFFFTIKFLAVVFAVFAIIKFYSDIAFSLAAPIGYDTEILDRASVSLRIVRNSLSLDAVIPIAAEQRSLLQDIKIAFVGDIMLDRSVKAAVDVFGAGNFHYPFLRIRDALAAYAFTFANLEGPISDYGQDQGGLYSFRMDPRTVEGLSFAGIDVVSLANNHTGDWGHQALADTFFYLSENNIAYVGASVDEEEAFASKLFLVGDTRFAILAYTQSGGMYRRSIDSGAPDIALIDETRVTDAIARARRQADIVAVSFHFGEEYKNKPNEYQQMIAHMAVDAGADIVVGHHPHVVQPLEKYGNGFIVYSLGNFIFDQNFSSETMEGAILEATIRNKRISGVALHKVILNQTFQPELAQETIMY